MISFVILGGGWRSEFYLRIAKLVPEEFKVQAVYVRNEKKRAHIENTYNVKVCETIEETLKEDFDFIVNCVSYGYVSDLSIELADKGYFVLSETPALRKPETGHCYEKIQVAEQYHQKGTYQAIKKLIKMGIIGDVNHVNISVAHDYHAMSMIRFLFDDYTEPVKLYEKNITDSVLLTHGRGGESDNKRVADTNQKLIVFDFNGKTAIYDYNSEQYFSPIRRDRLLVRGTRGEINNNCVRYFNEDDKLVESEIVLKQSGLLEGFYNDRVVLSDKVLYEFKFKAARLSEEECAIAECLIGMKRYIDMGEEFYSYERAYEDYYFFKK